MKNVPKIALLITAVALPAFLAVGVSFRAFRQIKSSAAARQHAFQVIQGSAELLGALLDAETGERGYLLTRDNKFLKPYLAVRDTTRSRLEALRQLAVDNAAHAHLDQLVPLIDAKLSTFNRNIGLRRERDLAEAMVNVRSDLGRALMDEIRFEIDGFKQAELERLARQDARFQADLRHLFLLIVFVSAGVLLAAGGLVYSFYRANRQKLKDLIAELKAAELQRANRLKSEFLNNMSYELRDPLNSINGFAELLSDEVPGPLNAKQGAYARSILSSGQGLLAFIDKILAMARV